MGAGNAASHFVRLPTGVNVHYVSYGDEANKPLIFIPGWTCTTPMFRFQFPYFSSRYRTMSYDPRSTGRSEKTAEGNSYRQRGDDLDAFIRALDLRSVTLVGWSWGAFDMLAYVRDHGLDRAAGLVVVDEPPIGPVPAGDVTTWGGHPLTPDGLPRFLRRVFDDRRGVWTGITKFMLGKPASTPDDDPLVA
jgi:pimeloyl-ACP methyl ester carboxylesterase